MVGQTPLKTRSKVFLFAATCVGLFALTLHALAQPASPQESTVNETELRSQAISSLNSGDQAKALEIANQLIENFPQSPAAMLTVADTLLRSGKSEKSLKYFDIYLKAEPNALPYLWQRGIAQYFAGKYKEGVKQFEVHRRVNPNDVENAAWHFLCLAKAESFQKATTVVLPAPGDPRIPMEEVLEMLKSGDTDLVKKRLHSVPAKTGERIRANFYGYFYLGLYADAKGNQAEALDWLKKSASGAPHHYMGDIARVYVQYLEDQNQTKNASEK